MSRAITGDILWPVPGLAGIDREVTGSQRVGRAVARNRRDRGRATSNDTLASAARSTPAEFPANAVRGRTESERDSGFAIAIRIPSKIRESRVL